MSGDPPEVVSDSIRYGGKAVDDPEWIAEFVSDRRTGVLGVVDDGTPHLVTQLFVYDEAAGDVYVHGAQGGRTYDVVTREGTTECCFTTSETGRFIPADEPVNFTVEYASVVAYGTVDVLDDPAEKREVLERFMTKFAPHLRPGEDYEEMSAESIDRTAVYRVDVASWSGKEGTKEPDYPGAYELDAVESRPEAE